MNASKNGTCSEGHLAFYHGRLYQPAIDPLLLAALSVAAANLNIKPFASHFALALASPRQPISLILVRFGLIFFSYNNGFFRPVTSTFPKDHVLFSTTTISATRDFAETTRSFPRVKYSHFTAGSSKAGKGRQRDKRFSLRPSRPASAYLHADDSLKETW